MSHPHSEQLPTQRCLPFQRLDVYQVALALVRLAATVPAIRGHAEIRDQLRRAAASVALNVAEGSGKTGAASSSSPVAAPAKPAPPSTSWQPSTSSPPRSTAKA